MLCRCRVSFCRSSPACTKRPSRRTMPQPGSGSQLPCSVAVSKQLDVRQPCGLVDRQMDSVVTNAFCMAMLPVASDAMYHLAESGQLPLPRRSLRLDIHVDQIARCLTLVALHCRLGLQISQTHQAQLIQGSCHRREGSGQQPADMSQVQPLMAELHSALEAVWIESPLLWFSEHCAGPSERPCT